MFYLERKLATFWQIRIWYYCGNLCVRNWNTVNCYRSYSSYMSDETPTSWELITNICRDITGFQLQAAWRVRRRLLSACLLSEDGNMRCQYYAGERNYKLETHFGGMARRVVSRCVATRCLFFRLYAATLFSLRHSTCWMSVQRPSLRKLH